jgi:hypothetical protein
MTLDFAASAFGTRSGFIKALRALPATVAILSGAVVLGALTMAGACRFPP